MKKRSLGTLGLVIVLLFSNVMTAFASFDMEEMCVEAEAVEEISAAEAVESDVPDEAANDFEESAGELATPSEIGKTALVGANEVIGDYDVYRYYGGGVGLRGYHGTKTVLDDIPAEVTQIDSGAFSGNNQITKIVIPAAVTALDYQAFQNCTTLETVEFLGSNVSIGSGCFKGCIALKSIALPENTIIDGSYQFENCTALETVTFGNGLNEISNSMFSGCSALSCGIVLPASVTKVGDYAFKGTKIVSFKAGSGLTKIGYEAFRGIKALTSVTFSKALSRIEASAFRESGIKKASFSGSEMYMGGSCFQDCKSMTLVTMPGNVYFTESGYTANSQFKGCTALKTVTFKEGMTEIPRYMFEGCSKLTCDIVLPDSCVSVGYQAFYGTAIASFTAGADLEEIAESAFDGVTALESVALSKALRKLGDYAFRKSGVTSISFKTNTLQMGDRCFQDCKNLTSVTLPGKLTYADQYSYAQFTGCTGLKKVTFKSGITEIPKSMFEGCTSLAGTVTIPDTVTSISSYAFYNTGKITEVVLGKGVQTIGQFAFSSSKLKKVTFNASSVTLGGYCFSKCSNLTNVDLPQKVTYAVDSYSNGYEFANCGSLESVTFGSKMTKIDEHMFYGSALSCDLVFPDTLTTIGSSAFYGTRLSCKLVFPDTLTTIGSSAFQGTAVTSVEGGAKLKNIGGSAFGNIKQLKSVTLNASSVYIGTSAFQGSGIQVLSFKGSTVDLGDHCFAYCDGLTSVTLPKNTKVTGTSQFFGCDNLTYVKLTSGIKTISESMFSCCGIRDIMIPASVETIGKYAFSTYKLTIYCYSGSAAQTYAKNNKIDYVLLTKGYRVAFNGNGSTSGFMGDMMMDTMSTSKNLPKNVFKKTGYTFTGWAKEKDGSVKYTDEQKVSKLTTKADTTVTLYAKWKKNTYKITYKLDGGKNNSSNPASYTVTTSTITLAKPTKKGYTFEGWYKDSSFKSKVTKISKGSTGSKTFYAKWKKNTYKITYVLNGGTNNSENPTAYTVTASTKTLKSPTKKGYTFVGWYTESTFKTKVTQIKTGSTGSKTFYAKWTANKYTIAFNANGGTGTMSKLTGVSYSTTKTLTANAFKRSGYTFTGWNTKKDGSGTAYKDKASVSKLSSTNGATVTLYAQWKKK